MSEAGERTKPATSEAGEFRTRYRTGDAAIDQRLIDLLDAVGTAADRDQLFEILVSGVRLAGDGADRLDLKITNAALKEMRAAFRAFAPYRDRRKATIFGSARTVLDHPAYVQARDLAARLAAADWMVVTGAGPGIMSAGLEGRRARAQLRREHPPAVRAGPQPLHRRRPEAHLDEVLLHPQAHADEGIARLRVAARRVRHPRRDLRAPHARADGQGITRADRPARRAGRHLLVGPARLSARPTSARRATSTTTTTPCSRSPTTSRSPSTSSSPSGATSTRSAGSAAAW